MSSSPARQRACLRWRGCCPAGHRAEAEDLLQGAYERAYRRWGRISRRGDPNVTYARCWSTRRSTGGDGFGRHPEVPLVVTGADPGTADTAAVIADRDPPAARPRSASPPAAAVLVLRYFEDPLRVPDGDDARLQRGHRQEPDRAGAGATGATLRVEAGARYSGAREGNGCTMTDFRAQAAGRHGRHPLSRRRPGCWRASAAGTGAMVLRVAAACVRGWRPSGVAGTLVTRGTLAGPAGTGPAAPAVTGAAIIPARLCRPAPATAAPGTVLRDCQSNNNGTLGSNWKTHSVHAGPVLVHLHAA